MQRNRAVAIATACLGLVIAVTTAVGLNLGILSLTSGDEVVADDSLALAAGVAAVDPAMQKPDKSSDKSDRLFPEGTQIITVYVDEPTPEPLEEAPVAGSPTSWSPYSAAPSAPAAPAAPAAPVASAPAASQPSSPTNSSQPAPTAAPKPTTSAPAAPQPKTTTPAPAAPTATPVPPAPTPTQVPTAAPSTVTYPVYTAGSAGSVALVKDGSSIGFWGAYPTNGWQYMVENNGPKEVKVKFLSPSGHEVEFKAELNGSNIKIEVGD